MSVVVRMEMPENCCECQLRQEDYEMGEEFCPFTGVECLSIGRQNNCPIICSLPEGHGRLIDASYVIDVMQDELDNDVPITVDDCFQIECKIPTIVPADTAERSET